MINPGKLWMQRKIRKQQWKTTYNIFRKHPLRIVLGHKNIQVYRYPEINQQRRFPTIIYFFRETSYLLLQGYALWAILIILSKFWTNYEIRMLILISSNFCNMSWDETWSTANQTTRFGEAYDVKIFESQMYSFLSCGHKRELELG